VTITGTSFTGAKEVKFGTAEAKEFKVGSATSITAESPAGTGTVNVTVTNTAGTSPAVKKDEFKYKKAKK
jgi:PKD repeat protein